MFEGLLCAYTYRQKEQSSTLNTLRSPNESHLRKLCKVLVSKQRHVAKQFVTYVRFWGVEGAAVVADVLRRVEHTKGLQNRYKYMCRCT